ncbi:MAG: hypothetical protein RL044_708 [Actinomycetota bacterium]
MQSLLNRQAEKVKERKSVEKEGAVALGESYRRLPGSMGDVSRQKLTQGQLAKPNREGMDFVPHLGD